MEVRKFSSWMCLAVSLVLSACAASGTAIIEKYADVTSTRFEGAVAVVLEASEKAKVGTDGMQLVIEGFRRIKLLGRKAMDCGRNDPNCRLMRSVCYKEGWEKVDLIEARTIAPDGEIIEIDKDDISDRTWTTWAIPQQDQRCFVWQAKGAATGSILEERYVKRVDKMYDIGEFWFQDQDPVITAEYTLDAPVDYPCRWKLFNIDITPSERKEGNRIIRKWTAKDISPLVSEYAMVAPDDLVSKLLVVNEKIPALYELCDRCIVKTWEDLGNCDAEILKKQQVATEPVKEVALKIAATAKTETEKVKAVWKYMNENIRYVGLESGHGGWVPLSAHVVCTKKYGDCKAVGGLITVLCRELGLKADPVSIGTRFQMGQLDLELPYSGFANHVIARVEADGKVYWLDATYRTYPHDTIPYNDQGVNVLISRPEASFVDRIPIEPPEKSNGCLKTVFHPLENGDVTVEAEMTMTGNYAGGWRNSAFTKNAEQWKRMIEGSLTTAYPQSTVTEQSFHGKEDNEAPFQVRLKARIPKAMQSAGRGVVFEIKELFPVSVINLIAPPKRRHTAEWGYLHSRNDRFELKIPKGMVLAGLPKNVIHEDEFLQVERLAQIENDRFIAVLNYKIKKLQITPEEYPAARKSYQKLHDATTFAVIFEPEKRKEEKKTK